MVVRLHIAAISVERRREERQEVSILTSTDLIRVCLVRSSILLSAIHGLSSR